MAGFVRLRKTHAWLTVHNTTCLHYHTYAVSSHAIYAGSVVMYMTDPVISNLINIYLTTVNYDIQYVQYLAYSAGIYTVHNVYRLWTVIYSSWYSVQ